MSQKKNIFLWNFLCKLSEILLSLTGLRWKCCTDGLCHNTFIRTKNLLKIQKLFQAQNNKTTCFLFPLSIIWWCSTRRAVFSNLHCNKMWPYFLHQDPNEFNLFHFSWIYFIWSKENEKTLWGKLSQDKKHFSN